MCEWMNKQKVESMYKWINEIINVYNVKIILEFMKKGIKL